MKPDVEQIKQWLGSGSINIFGKPFSGKDTQGRFLAELFDGITLSGGQILRDSADRIPPHVTEAIRQGKLAPTDEYVKIVLPYLHQEAFRGKPLILSSVGRWHGEEDGVIEATTQSGHQLKAVIYLDLDDDQIRQRWHMLKDLNDRGDRHDDTLEILDTRLQEYSEKTLPVIDFYRQHGLLIDIDGNQPPNKVSEEILEALANRASTSP